LKPEIRQARQVMTAEFLGTAFLVAAVVGSGIMGERLASGNAAIALLANSIATGAILVALILTLSPLSGAHFNPVVTLVMAFRNGTTSREVLQYLGSQGAGALVGVACGNLMFGLPPFSASQHIRTGGAQVFSEFVATFGLLMVILVCGRFRQAVAPYAVAGYITAAYWFTASTSFANPAVTVARALTNTFSGIRPGDVPLFILAQMGGGAVAALVFRKATL
jgi:glycerol uptake facilitator-like aquaporin